MAEPDPDSSVDLKHITTPGFFSDSFDAGRSPTSPLDFGGLFSPRSSSSPLRNKWLSDKVGLSLLSSSLDLGGHDALFRRDYIVLSPQIKVNIVNTITSKLSSDLLSDPCLKSNSLPRNYAAPSLSDAVNIHSDVIVEEYPSPRRSSSSPMDIISTEAYSRSLSGCEMALSEDYTCIISHGPNPKTTHIFGDCILDCDPKELGKEDIEIQEEGDDDSVLVMKNLAQENLKIIILTGSSGSNLQSGQKKKMRKPELKIHLQDQVTRRRNCFLWQCL